MIKMGIGVLVYYAVDHLDKVINIGVFIINVAMFATKHKHKIFSILRRVR